MNPDVLEPIMTKGFATPSKKKYHKKIKQMGKEITPQFPTKKS